MAGERILVVDDEQDIRELLRYNLEKERFVVSRASSGEEALALVRRRPFELVILDLMLPGVDGFEVCRTLKGEARTASLPIVILTAKGEDADIIAGLDLGADDYITKPFSPKVLVARIRTVLRRRKRESHPFTRTINIRGLSIDPDRHRVLIRERPVDLTPTEFALLSHIASQPGWVFTRGQLIDAIKGSGYAVTERSIDVQIAGLRRKLGAAGRDIETVHGVGYRFKE